MGERSLRLSAAGMVAGVALGAAGALASAAGEPPIAQAGTEGATILQSATATPAARPAASAPKGTPKAARFQGAPPVGALFFTTGGKRHFCTAAVVDSAARDLVVTAAHCVYSRSGGYARDIAFVPAYHDGHRPYGTWPVRTITLASGWQRKQDPNLDVAFLTVGRQSGPRVQSRTGGLTLGTGHPYNETVEAIGYNDTASAPVRCRARSFRFRAGQREFYCRDFWDGTSGGPWIAGYDPRHGTGTVVGVIGGYEQGGDYDWASYSAYFGQQVRALFRKAGGDAGKGGGLGMPAWPASRSSRHRRLPPCR